jgi:hypothetical protein
MMRSPSPATPRPPQRLTGRPRPHPPPPVVVAELADDRAGLAAEYGKTDALAQVRLFGAFQITTSGELRLGLRANARELLAYYLVHPVRRDHAEHGVVGPGQRRVRWRGCSSWLGRWASMRSSRSMIRSSRPAVS